MFLSYKARILNRPIKICGKMNGVAKPVFFSRGTNHSKGVCALINPSVNFQIDYSYANTSGRIIQVTIVLGSQKVSLCNIYAPNNRSNQLEFMQELNNCIIDKTELTIFTVKIATGLAFAQRQYHCNTSGLRRQCYSSLQGTHLLIYANLIGFSVSFAKLRRSGPV